MFKNILIKTAICAGAGGIVYGMVVVFLNYFAPIVGVIAGFVSGMGLVVLGNHCKNNKKDIFYFVGVAALSLLIGFFLVYYFKVEIIHGMTYHPKDFSTLPDFIADTLGIPDILSAVIGGSCGYALSKNNMVRKAVYRYLRLSVSV